MPRSRPRPVLLVAIFAMLALLICAASAPAAKLQAPDKRLAAWTKQVTSKKPPVKIKRYRSRFKIPARLQRSIPALSRKAAKLAREAERRAATLPARQAVLLRTATAASDPDDIGTLELETPTQVVDGVELSARATLSKDSNGHSEAEFNFEAKAKGYTLRFTPIIDFNEKGLPDVGCPTADGKLKLEHTAVEGGTAIVMKGRSVVAARTVRMTTTTKASGQVGRDARLASATAAMQRRIEHFERGLQVDTRIKRSYKMQREGDPVGSKPDVTVKIKAAQASKSEVREGQRRYAQQQADGPSSDLAPRADLARWKMLRGEFRWYQLPNYCARASIDPSDFDLQEGQSRAVKGTVRANDGGESPGSFEVVTQSRGSLAATKAAHDPGSPAELTATAAAADAAGNTVYAEVVATSMGGRAQVTFTTEGEKVKVPTSFGGWIESTTTGDGIRYHFDASFEFTRTSVATGPGGFATAWYELTAIDAEHESYNELGPAGACRWVAKAPSGNVINAGDVELRRASANAPWTYAINVDISVLNQVFEPTDCPPDAAPPAFTGDIVNQLYTNPGGNNFRQIWSGSTENDMRLIEMDFVTDVRGPGEFPTSAKWGLIGSFE